MSKLQRYEILPAILIAEPDATDCYCKAADVLTLETQLADAMAEGGRLRAEVVHWKANHDNAIEKLRTILDRPDLGDKAKRVAALIADYAALRARCEGLREALLNAQEQLRYLWNPSHTCPCGARPDSLDTRPHVAGCACVLAVAALATEHKHGT